MTRILIELRYQRVPKQHVHSGLLSIGVDGTAGNFSVPFYEEDLQDVAVRLHYAVRLAANTTHEFAVRLVQSSPTGSRAVPNDLTTDQVNAIYDSEESARQFLAPMHAERKIKDGSANQ